MESEQFDRLARGAASASRRGLLHAGAGALAAAGLASLGYGPEASEARRRRRKKRLVCFEGQTLQVHNRKRFLRRGGTKGACAPVPETCPSTRPVTCGNGCCPAEYSLCCEETTSATDTHSCNPPDATCCPASQGGGSCPTEFFGIGLFPDATVCCPATKQTPRGWCAEAGGDCCTTEEGGFACPPGATCCPLPTDDSCGCDDLPGPWCAFAEDGEICCTAEEGGGSCWTDLPVCCPDNENYPATCCPEGSTCCSTDDDCGGDPGSCIGGCCDAPGQLKYSSILRRARGTRSGVERFHMAAR